MPPSLELIKNSDTLVELLAAQCAELEKLLALAREETQAAQDRRFPRVWEIVSERAAVGQKLELFQQQISELRGALESEGHNLSQHDITDRVIELANLTLIQDQETRKHLEASRAEASDDLKNLETFKNRTNAYFYGRTKGLAFNREL